MGPNSPTIRSIWIMYTGLTKPFKESWAFSLILPRHTMEILMSYSFIPSVESRIHLSNRFKCSYTICPQVPILHPAGPSRVNFQTAALTCFLISEVPESQQHPWDLVNRFCFLLLNFLRIKTPLEEDPPFPFSYTFSYLWWAPLMLEPDTPLAAFVSCGIIRM